MQIDRSLIVATVQVARVTRCANEAADIHRRGRSKMMPDSRSFVHLFRQM